MITLSYGSRSSIAFSIADSGGGLLGKRVTWAIGDAADGQILKKTSGLPGSSSEITIVTQTTTQITGVVNLLPADFANLPKGDYRASLWVDSGTGDDTCVTVAGYEAATVQSTIPRT